MSNTALWDSVCKTDPSHTKGFTKGGGFKGTAIKPFWLMRKATETFGVCGIGWGWRELENKLVAGVWCSKVELWFIHNNQKGAIEQWGQTEMEGEREIKVDGRGTGKFKAFVDEEAPKKAVTDAVTKCLSYLGFAGDVHMGLFDDSKYVAEMREEFAPSKSPFANAALRKAWCENAVKSYNGAESVAELNSLFTDDKNGKLKDMKESGNEWDTQGAEEVYKQYRAKLADLKQMEALTAGMPEDFNNTK